MNIMGISGEAGSGKDTFASIYKRLSNNVATVSLGDLVREELAKMGAAPDRKLQAMVANYRRDTAGSAYWIDRALAMARPDVETVILTGIYAPDEAM